MAPYRKSLTSFLAALGLLASPAQAQGEHWSSSLWRQLARVNAVDWSLSTRAAELCDRTSAGFGLTLDSLSVYPSEDRDAIAAALGMSDGIVVAAVAPGSPAAQAGLTVGDRLLSVNGASLDAAAAGVPNKPAPDMAEEFLAAVPAGPAAVVGYSRDGRVSTVSVTPVARCAARSILVVNRTVDAYSDDANLALTTGLVGFTENDDELALIAGHELAHIILAKELKARGIRRKRKEDAADLLGAQIAACAGYDLQRGSALWGRMDKTRFLSFLPTFTHRASKTRQKAIAAIGEVDCTRLGRLDG